MTHTMTSSLTTTMTTLARLGHMLAGWGGVGLVYFSTGYLQGVGVILPETALDRLIPYNPAGIWLYLSFFIFIPYTYLTAKPDRVRWLARSMPLCAVFCGLVFMTFPTTLVYPPLGDQAGASLQMLRLLQASDSPQNCLPSLHGVLTLLCVWALLQRERPLRSMLAVLFALAIGYSIIQLRRHVSIDLAAGLLVGLCGGWAVKLAAPPASPQRQGVTA